MLHKLCKTALLGLLAVGTAGGAWAEPPGVGQVPVAATVPPAPVAALWAATADYVYHDDPTLKPLATKLAATIGSSSVAGFERGLNEAVKLEGKPLKDSHVFTLQTTYTNVQARHLPDPVALAAAIEAELLSKRSERRNEPGFRALIQNLTRIADNAALAADAQAATPTPAEAADNPMNQTAPPAPEMPAASVVAADAPSASARPAAVAATSGTLLWLALGMAGLSLAGVAFLLLRPAPATAPSLSPLPAPGRSSTSAPRPEPVKWAEITRYVQQELDKRLAPPVAAAAPPETPLAPAPEIEAADLMPLAPPVPLVPSAPRSNIQYVNEAPFNNSFRAQALSDQPGSYSIFAVEFGGQHPDQGTFTVTGNLASHVRDHRSVLEPVCEYASYPAGSETRVVTERPGHVRRRGEDWEVVSPAKVRFE